jgi:lipooligosaccharide transport system permease protein
MNDSVALSGRALAYWWVHFRSTIRRQLLTSFVQPALYLGALGLGLGSLIGSSDGAAESLGGVRYIAFLAPGLMAAAAMQQAATEAMWPVIGAKQWTRMYAAQQATPLGPSEVFAGHLAWMLVRACIGVVPFVVLLPLVGAFSGAEAVLAFAAAVLTGAAFATPLAAWAITRERETSFVVLQRFVIVPMYLLSGTFTPVAALGAHAETVAAFTPLYHGVVLCRSLSLGTAELWPCLGHVAYLVAVTLLGFVVARRQFTHVLAEVASA